MRSPLSSNRTGPDVEREFVDRLVQRLEVDLDAAVGLLDDTVGLQPEDDGGRRVEGLRGERRRRRVRSVRLLVARAEILELGALQRGDGSVT